MSDQPENKPNVSPLEALRAATVGQRVEYRTKKVEVNGSTFELRELSEKKRRNVINRAKAKASQSVDDGSVSVTMDVAELRVWLVIEMCYVPDTNTSVFSVADYDTLMSQPTGRGWFNNLADEAWLMFNSVAEELDPGKSEAETTKS